MLPIWIIVLIAVSVVIAAFYAGFKIGLRAGYYGGLEVFEMLKTKGELTQDEIIKAMVRGYRNGK